MPSLGDFQQDFGAALADPGFATADPRLARALLVHRNTSAKAARDALAANYPVVRALFGEAAFAACASAFVALSPPREPRLNAYGAGFSALLASYAPAMATPYAADVAALERLVTEALFAGDAPALGGEELMLDPAASLRLHPAARFAAFEHPAVSLWRAHEDENAAALADLVWTPEAALVTRPADRVLVQTLPPGGLAFLEACAEGEPLAIAAAAAAAEGADLAPLFSDLIIAGAFA